MNYSSSFGDHPLTFSTKLLIATCSSRVRTWNYQEMNRSLLSRSLHLNRIYNLMYVNIITGSLIQKIATAHLLSARYFPEQGGSLPKELICSSLVTWKLFCFILLRVKNLIQKKILLRNKIGLMRLMSLQCAWLPFTNGLDFLLTAANHNNKVNVFLRSIQPWE